MYMEHVSYGPLCFASLNLQQHQPFEEVVKELKLSSFIVDP